MRVFIFLLLGSALIACSHIALPEVASTTPVSTNPDVLVADPTQRNLPFPKISYPESRAPASGATELVQSNVELGDGSVHVYQAHDLSSSKNIQPTFVVFYFGDASSRDFSSILSGFGFRGLFIDFSEYEGAHGKNSLAVVNDFEKFCANIFEKLYSVNMITDFNSNIVLLGSGWGAETINQLGKKLVVGKNQEENSIHQYQQKISGMGFFNAHFAANLQGLSNIGSRAEVGFRTYGVASKDFANGVVVFSGESEHLPVEAVFEHLEDSHVTDKNLMNICLPQFLQSLTLNPFITFHCQVPEK